MSKEDIGLISAHGTATPYNDEMEAKAVALAGLQHVPLNSLKGYFGHTLGAAGLIETILTKQSMLDNTIVPTPRFKNLGVSVNVNVSAQPASATIFNSLKTASGFGGCNAAVVISR